MNKDIYKLYLVTDDKKLVGKDFFDAIQESVLGGVTLVQLREKNTGGREFYEKALKLKDILFKYNIPLIINDRIDIAIAVSAHGVHLGQKDIPVKVARELLGKNKIIGATANTVELAIKAEKDGADYIGAGALFYTDTKNDTKKLSVEELTLITKAVNIPVVAIGGINSQNISFLENSGIKGVAVSSGILGETDIKGASKCLRNKLKFNNLKIL